MQEALQVLNTYWTGHGCLNVQPMNTEVGAGTLNPSTFLRVQGPEPWRVAYVEPSVRPDDSRYGENPNRLQTHTQYQVILKPEPGNAQELFLGSLRALGIDTDAHDIRFVEDNWASPALGAWGLGWEVWLDGLEITQFTYFQQAGGITLDPVSVEITYGIERILMALQDVKHFKDLQYAPGVTYGEAFGQAEYEMSRYYLDEADLDTQRTLFEAYAGEARRLLDARLPVPAYSYVLKCSHTFNVLDARGAISTTERARSFARMRGLAHEVAALWVSRREELGFPLGTVPGTAAALKASAAARRDVAMESAAPQEQRQPEQRQEPEQAPAEAEPAAPAEPAESAAPSEPAEVPEPVEPAAPVEAGPATLVMEIGVEEMPPAEVTRTSRAVREALTEKLAATRLGHGDIRVLASPRRVVAVVDGVEPREPDYERTVRGPKLSAAFDAEGNPTKAVLGFARSNGADPAELSRVTFGANEHVALTRQVAGRPAEEVLSALLPEIVTGLRAEKNMRWNVPKLAFTRPIRWIMALLGDRVVPFAVSTLESGRTTQVHRDAVRPVVEVPTADGYVSFLERHDILADADERRRLVVDGAVRLAAEVGGYIDTERHTGLIDEITNLVEAPTPILGGFDAKYLSLPADILVTVMRKHQRYLPVVDARGEMLPYFVAVANGRCDHDVVRRGNEAVLRARYEDASFFWKADLETPLTDMKEKIRLLTFEERLGSMADRADRISAVALRLGESIGISGTDRETLERAAALTKFDLGSQMVTELSSLAGVMAREYAYRAGEGEAVAQALFENELPRSAGDLLPGTLPGALLALADRFDLLAGLFAIGAEPSGSSDPFGLRRSALGVVNILLSRGDLAALTVRQGLAIAAEHQAVPVSAETVDGTQQFVVRRFEQQLIETGHATVDVRAVLVRADAPLMAARTLEELESLRGDERFATVLAAFQRIRRIVPADVTAGYDRTLFWEGAEQGLHDALSKSRAVLAGESSLVRFSAETGELVAAVNTFFDDVLVMADDPRVRANRLGLLAAVRDLAEGLIDWEALV
ncbi:glycine--tRNA ligase subunit beta [Streptomyces sp. NPDC058195]|uniref:glycine--tRNA ligase subunit beta n=1 Tax=Streptomyces sp. NPDC058195 TaxID=3346375 RepID=UPI0036EDF19D